jgi:hypothetical protein
MRHRVDERDKKDMNNAKGPPAPLAAAYRTCREMPHVKHAKEWAVRNQVFGAVESTVPCITGSKETCCELLVTNWQAVSCWIAECLRKRGVLTGV